MDKILLAYFIASTMLGCATLFDGAEQQFTIATSNSESKDIVCVAENEEGRWSNLIPFQSYTIHKDGNKIKVSCESKAQIGNIETPPKFQGGYVFLDLMLDLCVISCVVDGINNSFYKYPSSIIVPMREK